MEDTDTKDKVPHDGDDNTMTKVKWSTETNDIDNRFLREYDNMCKLIEDRQITDYYQAQRHIQSAMMGDTPIKTVQNRQYIDNVSEYDSEHHRISKSVCHKLDLGPISLPGAKQYTTVETAAALKIQDKTERDFKVNMQNDNGQYRMEIYKRAESMIPQLDGTYNVSDNSDTVSHDYLDLASTNIIQYRTRGQRQKASKMAYANRCSANIESIKPNTRVRKQRRKVPDDKDIDMDKIVKDDTPRYARKQDFKDTLHDRKRVTETEKQLKDKEAKRLALEKAQIEALIRKHRPRTPKTPNEVNTLGTGKNANIDGKEGTKKGKPPHKKATKASQIKTSQNKGDKPNKDNSDTLLGDPMVSTKKSTYQAKEKGQKGNIGADDIGIFEFIFEGLPNPPDLEGIDEDRLFELQNAVQEQLCKRDEERERNITKRVQEFEKTFDFVNSHLLKGVATMAKLTKTDNRQPIGKIKPTDKMVMMLSLFDGTKPETSKQHYERFNPYINFQTKSGHLTDPVREAIDLFKHTLDKTALVWFQMNRAKFKDLTTLKMMFLQRYNPWGKTKREQLQSWNILSFDPKKTDVDEHINLINTLGDMVDQKEEAKKEKFIETMPTMIQTHLIICKDWAEVKDKAKSLKYII